MGRGAIGFVGEGPIQCGPIEFAIGILLVMLDRRLNMRLWSLRDSSELQIEI